MVNFMVNNGRPLSPGSVLLIEDDQALREALIELLGLADVTCLDTPSGCEGVRLFRQHRQAIDLVIMDMGLSDTNGAAAIQELEAICPDVKIIVISGQEKRG
jgi:DNA-binding NarL/FixJ family response regulator